MDPPCHRLPKGHEGVWGKTGGVFVVVGVFVVGGGVGIGGPVWEEDFASLGRRGPVGLSHEFGGAECFSLVRGGEENQRETCEAFL